MTHIKFLVANAAVRAGTAVSVEQVIGLIDQLVVVLDSENAQLARGIPASLSDSIRRKNELASGFEQYVARIRNREISLANADAALRRRLIERAGALHVKSAENVERLRAAMEASRRRVDAVMQAIREQVAPGLRYGANGQMHSERAAQSYCGPGIRV